MIHAVSGAAPAVPEAIIAAAANAWRRARDDGDEPQPQLHALLAPQGYDMLAPVIDSLMMLGEACLGRPLCRGCPFGHGDDAAMLCALLAEPGRLASLPQCRRRVTDTAMFSGALASARTMLAMA